MGARAGFRRIQTTDSDINRLQDNVQGVFEDLTREVLLGAQLIQRIPLVAGVNVLSHGLGVPYRSWIVCAPSAIATIIDAPTNIPQDPATLQYRRNQYLALNASAPVTIDLVVF